MLLGVDVGGTFTDAVAFDGTAIHTAKSATTPGDESAGVASAIAAVLERAGASEGAVTRFVHGMTVGTNALLEERGARTGLVITRGFADVLEIGRQDRPSLYRLCEPKPDPLVAPDDRFEVGERCGPDGIVEALESAEAQRVARAVADSGVEAVAVCLLFSYADADHEQALARAIEAACPGVHISASHEVLPRFREYERASTTVIDAYLSPLIGGYLSELAEITTDRGIPAADVMRSSGGIAPWQEAAREGAWSVLSGPAGGAVGAGLIAELCGDGNAVGFDMGGTSCDVCAIEAGKVKMTDSREIGGRIIQLPMVDVHTVGAGGGSVAWRDHGGALRVGPRSAGAVPGPACYGNGGEEATVTDANLVLGRLAPGSSLAGDIELDAEASRDAVSRLGSELGLDPQATAAGIVRLANAEMVRALRVVTVERGIDPRAFALLAFGGAGPMHAAELAAELGMSRLVCPRTGGVLSALGLLASPRRRDTARTVMLSGADLNAERVSDEVAAMRTALAAGMDAAEISVTYELRYEGQSFELAIDGPQEPTVEELEASFADAHERRYGFRVDDAAVELVAIGLAASESCDRPRPQAAPGEDLERSSRDVYFEAEWHDASVLRGEPGAGERFDGPAVIELPEATLVLPPGWSGEVDEHGTILAEAG